MKKKVVLLSVVAVTMIFNIGCTNNEKIKSKEIIFEDNVLESLNTSVKVTQEEVNFIIPEDTEFIFNFYKEGKLYGYLNSISNNTIIFAGIDKFPMYGVAKEELYEVGEDLVVRNTGEKLLTFFEDEGIKGINSDRFGTESAKVYYYDYEINERKEVTINSYLGGQGISRDDELEVVSKKLVEGNDDFGYVAYNYQLGDKSLVNLQVIDLKNNKVYEYKEHGEQLSFIVDIVYNKITEKFYAINNNGVIYELSFKNEEIIFVEKEKLDLGGIALWYEDQVAINKDGEIVIMYDFVTNTYTMDNKPIYDEKYMGNTSETNELLITYNPSSNEIKRIMQNENKDFEVIQFWGDTNLFIIEKGNKELYGQEYYIGELKGDRIDLYHKIEMDAGQTEKVWLYNAIINENNNEILLHFRKSGNASNYDNSLESRMIKVNIER